MDSKTAEEGKAGVCVVVKIKWKKIQMLHEKMKIKTKGREGSEIKQQGTSLEMSLNCMKKIWIKRQKAETK